MSQINQDLYNEIISNIPIICVDAVIVNSVGQILFLRRENEPEKGNWWFPGGRLLKNEKLDNAIIRKVKEETNLNVKIDRYIGLTETIFNTGPSGIPVHTINHTYKLSLISNNVKIDNLHSDYIWTNKIEELNLNVEIFNLLKNNNFND